MVCGRGWAERGGRHQSAECVWQSQFDGAWLEDGYSRVHWEVTGREIGMRIHRVGIGDIGEVPSGAGGSGIEAGGDDRRRSSGELD